MTSEPKLLTEAEARDLLRYDPETGHLFWRERPAYLFEGKKRPASVLQAIWNTRYAGTKAGCMDGEGYIGVKLFDRHQLAHRLAWAIHYGVWPDQIDHINHDRTDNRLVNLRNVSVSENNRNVRLPSRNASGVVGVGWDSRQGGWSAIITFEKRKIRLGLFATIAEAATARKAAERQYGFHPNHGIGAPPEPQP